MLRNQIQKKKKNAKEKRSENMKSINLSKKLIENSKKDIEQGENEENDESEEIPCFNLKKIFFRIINQKFYS